MRRFEVTSLRKRSVKRVEHWYNLEKSQAYDLLKKAQQGSLPRLGSPRKSSPGVRKRILSSVLETVLTGTKLTARGALGREQSLVEVSNAWLPLQRSDGGLRQSLRL